jgi:predicted Rossmann fold nucleotide-binding protein DprA/Smf involved in DNA uptake
MKKLQDLLKSISESLVALSKQVEKISKQAGELQPSEPSKKKVPAKKVKTLSSKKAVGEKHMTAIDSVFEVIKRSRKGATIVNLKEKTGFNSRQLSNALYKLSKRDVIISKARGIYMKK